MTDERARLLRENKELLLAMRRNLQQMQDWLNVALKQMEKVPPEVGL